jgi:ABC-type lipoprotein release transport system permease subunit
VLCESALLIGIGGSAAVPVGGLLSLWLDGILRSLPGIPADARFFVFTTHAVEVHAALLVAGAVLAAVYPMRLVATLPIAATLRREVVS